MPLITPTGYPTYMSDGAVADVAFVRDVLCTERLVPDGLAVMNGRLDAANLSKVALGREHVRRGHVTASGMVARTVNLDYFDNLWPEIVIPDGATLYGGHDFRGVGGLSIAYCLDRAATALSLFWHISDIRDSGLVETAADHPTFSQKATNEWRLFLDDEELSEVGRAFPEGHNIMLDWSSNPGGSSVIRDRLPWHADSRHWSGHLLLDSVMLQTYGLSSALLGKGWHTASLRIASEAVQVRAKTSRIGYTVLY